MEHLLSRMGMEDSAGLRETLRLSIETEQAWHLQSMASEDSSS